MTYDTDLQHRTIVVLVENKAGVLARVADLFARRGYNIVSLAVAPTNDDRFSRLTIVVDLESAPLDQIVKQLFKLINVVEIAELAPADAVERELDDGQLERLRDGDADVLKDQVEDRLDRLYAAKTYLQSNEATANSEATRAVVEEIADREYELHRADLVDGESERGETH